MRINCWITPENRVDLSAMITAVNQQRAALGLGPVSQAHVLNDIIARAAEQSTINLCSVFVTREQRSQQQSQQREEP